MRKQKSWTKLNSKSFIKPLPSDALIPFVQKANPPKAGGASGGFAFRTHIGAQNVP